MIDILPVLLKATIILSVKCKMEAFIVLALWLFIVTCVASVDVLRHDVEDQLHTKLLLNYNKHVVPYPNSSSSVLVEFSPPLISISDLDASTQTLTSELFLKLVWNDSRLVWKPEDYFGIKVLLLPEHQVWQPDVKLLNSAKYGDYNTKSDTLVFVHHNGKVVWNSPATRSTHCEVNLKHFPYDVHTCIFKFGSWTHDGFQIDVDLHPSATENPFNSGFNVAGEWEIRASAAKKTMNKYDCCESHWPDVTFSVTLGRRSSFYMVAIFGPLFAIVVLLLASLCISPLKSERLTANFIALMMLVLTILFLSWKLAAVGSSVPMIMNFCLVLIILSSIATGATLVMSNLSGAKPYPRVLHWTQSQSFKLISGVLCISIPSFEPLVDQDNHSVMMSNEPSKNPQATTIHPEQLWSPIFQVIDRLTFVVYSVIIISIMIYIST